jgi:HEAT repeat protein
MAESGLHVGARAEGQYIGGSFHTRTVEQALQEYHVALTKPALIEALKSAIPEVRPLAAYKLLVNDRALDTIPLVEAAVAGEPVGRIKMQIALALAQVGDNVGISTLQNTCDDRHLEMSDRVEAAGYMLRLGRESCFEAVIEALQYNDEKSNSRQVALSLAPDFSQLPAADQILRSVLTNLADTDPGVGIDASHALAAWGKSSAVPPLESAVRSEQDDAVRAQMQADLSALREKLKRDSR